MGNDGHPFLSLHILQNEDLLSELKKLVTVTDDHMKATGVPPHVQIIKSNREIKEQAVKMTEMMDKQCGDVLKAVETTILENNIQSGVLSLNTLQVRNFLFYIILFAY